MGGGRCTPNLFIDGVIWFDGWDLIASFFLKEDVVGIEVYPSLGSTPPQFDKANGWGSVVIWMRR